jgi:hypothetical protein
MNNKKNFERRVAQGRVVVRIVPFHDLHHFSFFGGLMMKGRMKRKKKREVMVHWTIGCAHQ